MANNMEEQSREVPALWYELIFARNPLIYP